MLGCPHWVRHMPATVFTDNWTLRKSNTWNTGSWEWPAAWGLVQDYTCFQHASSANPSTSITARLLCMLSILLHHQAWHPAKLKAEKGQGGIDRDLLWTVTFEVFDIPRMRQRGGKLHVSEGYIWMMVGSDDLPKEINVWQDVLFLAHDRKNRVVNIIEI